MASFLTSALGGVNNLSNLVDKVNQIKDNIERTLDNAVADAVDDVPLLPATPSEKPKPAPKNPPAETLKTDQAQEESSSAAANGTSSNQDVVDINQSVPEKPEELVDQPKVEANPQNEHDEQNGEAESSAQEPITSEASTQGSNREKELQETLKRREAQLEKTSRQLAEQEEQLNTLREALENGSSDKRVRAAEAKAEQLMKEGLALSEKQGKSEQALRKVRKEKEELETREKTLAEQLKKEQDAKASLQTELNELRDVRKRGEASIAQIAESNADSARRLEEARSQAQQAMQREQEMKSNMERTFAEVADLKKQVASLNQQLNAAKREADHARFQLKEQLDSKQIHGTRSEGLERSLAETKAALEEQTKEARALEADLRAQLTRASEQLRTAEKRAEEAVARSLDATAPLLRQIDALNEQRAKQEQASSAMLTRAVAAEAAEAEAAKAKRRVEQARSELAVRVSELESLLAAAKAEASRAVSDCKIAQKRAEEAERERDSIQHALDSLRSSTDTKIAEHRRNEVELRQAIALETEKNERAKRLWEEKLREQEERHQVDLRRSRLEQQQQQAMQHPATATPHTPGTALGASNHHSNLDGFTSPPPSSATAPRRFQSDAASSVVSSSAMTGTQDEILGNALYGDEFGGNNDMMMNEGASSRYLLQTSELQAGIRRRDAKIKVLTEQLDAVTRQKDEIVGRMVEMQRKTEAFQGAANREAESAKLAETLRHQATLLMELLGEKEEQIDALQSDLEEVKATFRDQIQALLAAPK